MHKKLMLEKKSNMKVHYNGLVNIAQEYDLQVGEMC